MEILNLAEVNQFNIAEAFHVLCCDFLSPQMERASVNI